MDFIWNYRLTHESTTLIYLEYEKILEVNAFIYFYFRLKLSFNIMHFLVLQINIFIIPNYTLMVSDCISIWIPKGKFRAHFLLHFFGIENPLIWHKLTLTNRLINLLSTKILRKFLKFWRKMKEVLFLFKFIYSF